MPKGKLLGTSTVANTLRITVIKKAREELGGLEVGDTIAFYSDGKGGVSIKKI